MEERILVVPINPAVKKYIIQCWGNEPIACSQRNKAGRQVRALLSRKSNANYPNPSETTIQLKLTARLWNCRRMLNYHAKSNYLFLDIFESALEGYINGQSPYVGSRRKAYLQFIAIYNIEEDELPYENVERELHERKYTKRHKKYNKLPHTLIEKRRWARMSRLSTQIKNLEAERTELKKKLQVEKRNNRSLKKSILLLSDQKILRKTGTSTGVTTQA